MELVDFAFNRIRLIRESFYKQLLRQRLQIFVGGREEEEEEGILLAEK